MHVCVRCALMTSVNGVILVGVDLQYEAVSLHVMDRDSSETVIYILRMIRLNEPCPKTCIFPDFVLSLLRHTPDMWDTLKVQRLQDNGWMDVFSDIFMIHIGFNERDIFKLKMKLVNTNY